MPKLILIKHASPLVDPNVPSRDWKLSEKGRETCKPLAKLLGEHWPALVVSSDEPKAIETAALIGSELRVPNEAAIDLHEHDRSNVPHLRSGEFISLVELFFRRPSERVLGLESADEARTRFTKALNKVLKTHEDESIAVVSHGTVISLYLEALTQKPGFPIWREMGLPSFVVIDRETQKVTQRTNRVS